MKSSELIELIESAIGKDTKSQTKLINYFWQEVYHFVLRKIQDPTLADEITVSVFSKVLNKLHFYDASFEFKTWVLTIAQNTVIDFWRKNKNEQTDQFLDIENINHNWVESPEELLISQENSQHILNTLEMMDEKYKAIIYLRFYEEKSLKEISEELGLSLPNTKVRIMRAKKILAELFIKNGINVPFNEQSINKNI